MASNFRRMFAHLTTSVTDIYECPSNTVAVLIGGQGANVHVAATPLDANVDLGIWGSDAEDVFYLVRNLTIPVGSAIDLVTGKVVLAAGDKLQARGDIDFALDLVVAVLEVT